MPKNRTLRLVAGGAGLAVGAAAGAYAALAASTWLRYGQQGLPPARESDPLLDRFMPAYEVVERHEIHVKAPADVTFTAMRDVDFQRSRIIRAVFKGRELMLGSQPDETARPSGLLALTQSIGWGVLAEDAGREIVMGAVTQPWQANVVFRPVPPERFRAFDDPDFVKIAWTLCADALGPDATRARTETRVMATDAAARAKFRRYWALVAPGTALIRRMAMRLVRTEAERRARTRAGVAS